MKRPPGVFALASSLALMACAAVDEGASDQLDEQVTTTSAGLTPTVPIGLNLSAVNYYATQMPFDDVFQNRDAWMTTDGVTWDTGMAAQLTYDADGYPTQVPSLGQMVQAAVFRPVYDGSFNVTWQGDGELSFMNAAVSNVTANSLKITVTRSLEDSVFLRITRSNLNNRVRNIRFMPVQPITADFNASMNGVRVLRFMDWGQTNGNPIAEWSKRTLPTQEQGSTRGVSIETMIATANRFNADLWYNIPHQANDDFIQRAATLIRDTLDPALKVYVEYSNENWNGIFPQVEWEKQRGVALGLNHVGAYQGDDDGALYWAGLKYSIRRAAYAHSVFRSTFSATPSRVIAVVGGQSSFADLNSNLLDMYGQVAINPLANQPNNKVDALAVAPYFGKNYDENDNVTNLTVDEILNHAQASIATSVAADTALNKAVATAHNTALIAYEAGQHLLALAGHEEDTTFVNKLIAANRHPRMGDLYVQAHNAWVANGGGAIVYFTSCEQYSKYGTWGALEYQNQPIWEAPKAAALQYIRTPDRLVALRAKSNNKFVTAESAGNAALVNRGDPAGPGAWEKFILVTNVDGTISLKADINRLYVTAENQGTSPLIANRQSIGDWEKFQPVRTADGYLVLKAVANGKYVTFDINGTTPASARATALGDWEKLTVVDVGAPDRVVSLRAKSNNKYVTAENGGNSALVNRGDPAGAWEKYLLITNMDGTVTLKAQVNNRYVCAEQAGAQPLIANRMEIGPWEKFQLESAGGGYYALRSIANSKLVTFDINGTTPASARAMPLGDWEKFTITDY